MATISGETTAQQGKHHTHKALPCVWRPALHLPALGKKKNGPYATQLFKHCATAITGTPDNPDLLQLWTRPPLHEHYDYARRPSSLTYQAQLAVAACGRRPRACTGSTRTSTWWCDGRRGAYGAPRWCSMCAREARACNQWAPEFQRGCLPAADTLAVAGLGAKFAARMYRTHSGQSSLSSAGTGSTWPRDTGPGRAAPTSAPGYIRPALQHVSAAAVRSA